MSAPAWRVAARSPSTPTTVWTRFRTTLELKSPITWPVVTWPTVAVSGVSHPAIPSARYSSPSTAATGRSQAGAGFRVSADDDMGPPSLRARIPGVPDGKRGNGGGRTTGWGNRRPARGRGPRRSLQPGRGSLVSGRAPVVPGVGRAKLGAHQEQASVDDERRTRDVPGRGSRQERDGGRHLGGVAGAAERDAGPLLLPRIGVGLP